MKCYVWKPCSDQRWEDELRFSIWRFFEQSTIIYSVTHQPSITWSWRCVLNFSLLVLTFCRSKRCSMSNEQKLLSENTSTPSYVECNKIYQSKVCVQEFWYCVPGPHQNSGIECLALIFNLSFLRIDWDSQFCKQKRSCRLQTLQVICQVIYCFPQASHRNQWLSG